MPLSAISEGGGNAQAKAPLIPLGLAVVKAGLAYVGVKESPPNSNDGPQVRLFQTATGAYRAPWCASFIQFLVKRVSGKTLWGSSAYVPYIAAAARKSGWAISKPRAGAFVCYDWQHDGTPDHIGVIREVHPDGSFVALEGNTSSDDAGDQSNGGEVCLRHRYPAEVHTFIWAPFKVADPSWKPTAAKPAPKPPAPKPTASKKPKPAPLPRPSQLSAKGAAFIAGFEGFRSAPYRDSVGVWTIGYGHTHGVGPHTPPVTKQQAQKLLQQDAAACAAAVARTAKSRYTQPQFDALVSLAFNVGPGVLVDHTMGAAIAAGEPAKIAAAFTVYCHAGGKVLPGLQRRRLAEQRLFTSGRYA